MGDKRDRKKQKLKQVEAAYKDLNEQLSSIGRGDDPEIICKMVTEHLRKSDELYPTIKKKLEGSAADAKHLKSVIRASVTAAKQINTPKRFDVGQALKSLSRSIGDQEKLKENLMEECVKKCFMIAPTFEYFYGAIQREGLQVKQRKRRCKMDDGGQEAALVRAAERNLTTECEQDTTPKEVEAIYERVRDLTQEGKGPSVGLIPTLVDPGSFAQTVENIFHTAFLVKEGKLGVKKGLNNKPELTYEVASESQRPTQRREHWSQSVLSFSMADYQKWLQSQ